MNKIKQHSDYMDNALNMIFETAKDRSERLEEARRENQDYQKECDESRDFESQEKFDSGMKESDFL